jgi:choline-glycine betaine transporter
MKAVRMVQGVGGLPVCMILLLAYWLALLASSFDELFERSLYIVSLSTGWIYGMTVRVMFPCPAQDSCTLYVDI